MTTQVFTLNNEDSAGEKRKHQAEQVLQALPCEWRPTVGTRMGQLLTCCGDLAPPSAQHGQSPACPQAVLLLFLVLLVLLEPLALGVSKLSGYFPNVMGMVHLLQSSIGDQEDTPTQRSD